MSHVLEHFAVADIPKVLAEVRSSLSPSGVVLIDVPNDDARRGAPIEDSPHLVFFSPSSLAAMLERNGFLITSSEIVGASVGFGGCAPRGFSWKMRMKRFWLIARLADLRSSRIASSSSDRLAIDETTSNPNGSTIRVVARSDS